MMPRYYFRNRAGYYDYPLYNYPLVWLVVCLGVAGLCVLIKRFLGLDFGYFQAVSLIGAGVLSAYLIYQVVAGSRKNGSFLKYISALTIADNIRQSLLNTMNVNRMKDSPFLEVPPIEAVYQNEQINLTVGKLAGMYELDKITQDVNSSLRGIYKRFAVVSSAVSVDGSDFDFILEDVLKSQRFVVKNNDVSSFVSSNPHEIKLAKNLIWNTVKTPMLSVIGRTRSGKTVFSKYLLEVMQKQGWKICYYSTKGDTYTRQFQGESDPQRIIESLEKWLEVVKARNRKIADAGATDYTALNLKDVALVIDEIGMLNGQLSMNKDLKKRWEAVITALTGVGASSGVHIIAMSQRGTKDFFLPSSALTNARDAVIMLGLAADSGDDRRFLIPGYEIDHRAYGQGQGLAMFVTSGKRWEQPNFYETPYFEEFGEDNYEA